MAIRIVGVDLPQNKRGEIALTYIFGIGRSSSAKILDKAGVDKNIKVKDWTDDQAAKIREIIGAEYKVEGDLRSEVQLNIKRLMDIGCYRGIRHRLGLPVRGQSTKNNARTRKGKKKTVANKKKATKYLIVDMAKKTVAARKKNVKVDANGQLHVHSSFNNLIVSLANSEGQVISWSSAGKMGFRGSKKNTPYAAQMAAQDCAKVAYDLGLRKVKAYVKGPGNGRESAIRTVHGAGIEVTEIIDVTPLPHNGCRPPKRRRV